MKAAIETPSLGAPEPALTGLKARRRDDFPAAPRSENPSRPRRGFAEFLHAADEVAPREDVRLEQEEDRSPADERREPSAVVPWCPPLPPLALPPPLAVGLGGSIFGLGNFSADTPPPQEAVGNNLELPAGAAGAAAAPKIPDSSAFGAASVEGSACEPALWADPSGGFEERNLPAMAAAPQLDAAPADLPMADSKPVLSKNGEGESAISELSSSAVVPSSAEEIAREEDLVPRISLLRRGASEEPIAAMGDELRPVGIDGQYMPAIGGNEKNAATLLAAAKMGINTSIQKEFNILEKHDSEVFSEDNPIIGAADANLRGSMPSHASNIVLDRPLSAAESPTVPRVSVSQAVDQVLAMAEQMRRVSANRCVVELEVVGHGNLRLEFIRRSGRITTSFKTESADLRDHLEAALGAAEQRGELPERLDWRSGFSSDSNSARQTATEERRRESAASFTKWQDQPRAVVAAAATVATVSPEISTPHLLRIFV